MYTKQENLILPDGRIFNIGDIITVTEATDSIRHTNYTGRLTSFDQYVLCLDISDKYSGRTQYISANKVLDIELINKEEK